MGDGVHRAEIGRGEGFTTANLRTSMLRQFSTHSATKNTAASMGGQWLYAVGEALMEGCVSQMQEVACWANKTKLGSG